jgi:hypothetical protein
LTAISRIKGLFFSVIQQGDDPPPRYVDLAPTNKADESGIYSEALKFATNNANVSNIALTGPYGSGKSSIIKTFLKTYTRPVLPISLAAFLPEVDASVTTDHTEGRRPQKASVSKQEIERSILQQMLYGADANSLPLSRFKRIRSPQWWSRFISLFIIIGLFACWHLIQKSAEISSGAFFEPLSYTNWFNLICFAVGFIFIWQVLHQIYVKSLGISLKSISLNDVEIAPEATEEGSILNRHLDEIIYFFQSTKYDLVVIEDLDRFNNPDIFVTLREINSLVNANAGVKRPIRFLYALRDDMFINTDRTKFFEFIIPVIPIINSSNSIDKIIEQGQRLSLDKRLDPQFLREVSRYLNDLRLIQNIFNEYATYVANLDSDGDSVLDANKLLAILIYKNVLPSDFEELHREKGKLANILDRHDDYIVNAEIDYKNQISELEQKISDAEKQVPSDLQELRMIYAMALIAKIPDSFTTIDLNGARNNPIRTILTYQDFDQLIETSHINCRSPQGYSERIDISGLQKEINPNRTYRERKAEIEHKSDEFKDLASKATRELRAKISSLRTTKFNEIIRTNAQGTQKLFDAFGEDRDLVRFLVFEGFLDDTYYQYTSLFHSGRLSPNDNKYLIQIRSFNNPEPDFQIDNPHEVIVAMREDDFRQRFVLNKTLVDCILSNKSKYASQLAKLTAFMSSNFADCDDFFSVYYDRGKYVSELMSALFEKWPTFVSTALSRPNKVTHVAQMIAHLPKKHLETLRQNNLQIARFVSKNLSEILALKIDFEPSRLALLRFETKNLTAIGPYPAIARVLSDEGLYEISIENMEFVFRNVLGRTAIGDLRTKHYSTLLRVEDSALLGKVHHNFEGYVRNVLLKQESNTEEEVSAIVEVINRDEIETEYLKQFLLKQSTKLPSLEQIPTRLHSMMFEHRKIEASWENCLAYIGSVDFDAKNLTTFLQHEETLSILSQITVNMDDQARPLRQFLINNNDFEFDKYRAYVRTLPRQFPKFPNIDAEKKHILVEEGKIVFSDSAFAELAGEEEIQVLFIAKNIDTYFDGEEVFTLDDDFREKLLGSNISDDKKLKIVENMDLSSLLGMSDRASIIGTIFHRTHADVSDLSPETAQALIINTKPIAAQISLFNRCQKALSDEQLWASIHQLPKPFSEIEPGWRRPTIPNTPENLKFVEWLEARSIISSSKLTYWDEIRIHTFRK